MKRTLSLRREQLSELTHDDLAAVHGGAGDISLQTCPRTICDTVTMICYSTFCPTEGATP
jgi:hypothetical protein